MQFIKEKFWEIGKLNTINHKGTVTIETGRLILRQFTEEDLEPIFNNCWSDKEVWKWTNYKPMNSVSDVIY